MVVLSGGKISSDIWSHEKMTGSVVFIILQGFVVAISVAGGIFWLGNSLGKVKEAVKGLEKRLDSVDSNLQNTINIVKDELLSSIASNTEKIFNLALSRVPTDQFYPVGVHPRSVVSNSPLTLSVKGVEGAKKLDAETVAERLAKSISLPPDVSELRIQEACHHSIFSTWRSLFNDEEIRRIEEHVYHDGGNLADTLIIYAIVTRNYILKERGFDVPEYETEAPEDKE